ncbi:hypothetical protein [Wenjunlia vitaminophila]|nr:hypothetical protein [Wenjunlia vitaminophila]
MTDSDQGNTSFLDPNMGLPLGVMFGLVLGLLVLDNLAIGLGVGLALGVTFGAVQQRRMERGADDASRGAPGD